MFDSKNILLGLLIALGISIVILFSQGTSSIFIYNNF